MKKKVFCCIKTFLFVIILFTCHVKAFAQKATFKQIDLPSEIRSVNALICDSQNKVWLATARGLYSYDGKSFKRFIEPNKAEKYQINTITKDNNGNLWFGTYKGLLIKFTNGKVEKSFDIKPYCKNDNTLITSTSIDTEGQNPEILLTTSGGEIFSVNAANDKIKKLESPVEGTIYKIQYGYSPTVWLCTSDGFFTLKRNLKWKKKSDMYTAYGLFENNGKYWAIGRDKDKKAVLMLYYDENEDKSSNKRYVWENFELKKMTNWFTRFYELGFTKGEMVWMASQNGLIRYNPLNGTAKEYNKVKNIKIGEIRHIAVQNNRLIWICSAGRRFIRVDLK